MTLPPKALTVLVNLKAELLSRASEESVIITPSTKVKQPTMRHARVRGGAVQRMYRNMNERLARI